MTDYQPVTKALAEGADPAMLCTTCPWDRNCINPPSMTAAEIDARMNEASKKDEAAMAADPLGRTMPTGILLTAVMYAGKDTSMQACPVLGLRLRSGDGRKIADMMRTAMQAWVES